MPTEKKLPKKRKAAAAPQSRRAARDKAVDVVAPKRKSAALPVLPGDQRRALIAEAAYLRAQQRGFSGGSEVDDWLQAEAEVDGHFAGGAAKPKPKRRSSKVKPG